MKFVENTGVAAEEAAGGFNQSKIVQGGDSYAKR